MPITPDEFMRANEFDSAFASANRDREDVPAYDAAYLGLDDVATATGLDLPLSTWVWESKAHGPCKSERQQAIVRMFHAAIREKNTELVMGMVQRGVVSPDVPDRWGATPLATAIAEGNLFMVKLLLDLGAAVNLPAKGRSNQIARWRRNKYGDTPPELERTPLMLAAASGRLALVKLLIDAGADDGVIAPDGAMALRLAVDNKHREIVDFLPLRRGGAWRRWKTHNGAAMHRLKRAAAALYYFARFFVWEVPRFILWSVPKHTLIGLRDLAKWAWKKIKPFSGVFRREIKALPRHLRAAAKWVWRGLRALPSVLKAGAATAVRWLKAAAGKVWSIAKAMPAALAALGRRIGAVAARAARWCGRQVKAIPRYAATVWRKTKAVARWTMDATIEFAKWTRVFGKSVVQWLWKAILAIPSALKFVWEWVKKSSTAIGRALAALLALPIALVHTAALAVISLLRRARNVTFADLWAAIAALGKAVVDLPRQVWRAMVALGDVSYKVMETLFGFVGVVVYAIAYVVVKIVMFIPKHLLVMVQATMSSVKKGGHEVAVWINPKW